MRKKFFKYLLCFTLSIVLTVEMTITASASVSIPIISENLTSAFVQELQEIDVSEIDSLPDDQIDYYFEKAFPLSAQDYSREEKTVVLRSVSTFQKFQNLVMVIAALDGESTKDAYASFSGDEGASWVRDTKKSPLTFGEALSGTYTLEVDFLTYHKAVAVYGATISKSFFESLVSAGSASLASALICEKLGLKDLIIPSSIISGLVSVGWDLLCTLDRDAIGNVVLDMKYSDMMRVSFMTANGYLTKVYSKYVAPSTTYHPSTTTYTYYNIANPYPDLYGFWDEKPEILYTLPSKEE